ncbi:hypothetical protein NA78x_002567 [Anatilimnocola sp. NA78]|uniref:hypothetical protein n=1 Tax=Anatilimnocola sp. NA78 TaxID=3415683 RepID=UPI003CE578A8
MSMQETAQSNTPPFRSRQLSIEGLENRQVLAGDMLATMICGNAIVDGESANNAVPMESMADETVEVAPLNLDAEMAVEAEIGAPTERTMEHGSELGGRLAILQGLRSSVPASTIEASMDADVRVNSLTDGPSRGDAPIEALEASGATNTADGELGAIKLGTIVDGEVASDQVMLGVNSEISEINAAATNPIAIGDIGFESNAEVLAEANLRTGNDELDIDALGLGTNLDIDTAITANLLNDAALNSASNLGSSSLLNGDNNLNGSIGGNAALNLTGDRSFDDLAAFNQFGSANLSVADAANLALASSPQFNLTNQAADDFFTGLRSQNSLNSDANLNADASLFANLNTQNGSQDSFVNGSLNTSFNAGSSSLSQSRLGSLPLA